MASLLVTALLLVTAPGALGSSLRAPAHGSTPQKSMQPSNAVTSAAEAAKTKSEAVEVKLLREKLTKISTGLDKMLSPEGALSKTQVAATVDKFNKEIRVVLQATAHQSDTKLALKQLQDAQAGVQTLMKEITQQQIRLKSEGDEQEESLLLGLLMQRQKEPRSKLMEILNSEDFSHLKVVQSIIAAKDEKTPLFQQVATYLDQHSPKPVAKAPKAPEIPDKLAVGKDGKPDVTPIVLALETRLHKMQDNEKRFEQHHEQEIKELDRVAADKKNSKAAVHQIKMMKHSEQRQFAKESAMAKHDIQAIESAVEAVKKGDLTALSKAQGALDASMKAAQARSGKFLVLLQMMHRAQGQDCPYCAAQCVDKCHNEGKPYTTCLTECADAGKA